MPARFLLTVKDVVAIKGRGIMLLPPVSEGTLVQPPPNTVTLKYPNRTTRNVTVVFTLPMLDPPTHRPVGYLCELKDVDTADVPIGTEIWIEA